ncbi:MAG: hypothetical protein KBT75_18035 [Oleispira antarctica]|uniref:Uncharacterized protein n=1 Tax=Oleispira antarctica RB-8 TaxID=698738 RepID=R4YNL5_OLEAN|nr:hypothetical protein [Oleispira antarctica]CCK76547.1 hypothetical protein OLEAN_C23710 [Oleispira antarctica RB-8]
MKKLVLRYINLPLMISALSLPSYALEAMNDSELSLTTGEGIGVIVDNLSIHSADKRVDPNAPLGPGEFEITLDLVETPDQDQLIFSELRIHKTGTVSGTADSGGNFGTVNNPVFLGDLRTVDIFTGDAADPGNSTMTTTTVMRSEFPGASLSQVDRSNKRQEDNLAGYQAAAAQFESDLDAISDKFTAHIRFDDLIGGGSNNFRAVIDVEGFRFYGTYSDIFATANHGVSIAGATGLYVDQLTVSTSLPTSTSKQAAIDNNDYVTTPIDSRLTFNGIDIYTTLGTSNQPMTLDNVTDAEGNNQLQIEISPLPASVGIAPKSNIYVKSIYFGEKYNPELRTGLRSGMADDGTPENYHYAFQPDVGNTIEIRGMQVQHLRITTMDI